MNSAKSISGRAHYEGHSFAIIGEWDHSGKGVLPLRDGDLITTETHAGVLKNPRSDLWYVGDHQIREGDYCAAVVPPGQPTL